MKIIKTKKVIPEQTVEQTIYECEECGHQELSTYDAEDHYFDKHQKTISVLNYRLFWFDLEEQARYWVNNRSSRYGSSFDFNDGTSFFVEWKGAGWYCMEGQYNLKAITTIIDELEENISAFQNAVEELKKVI